MNEAQQAIAVAAGLGAFLGGLVGQLALGAVYLRRIVPERCDPLRNRVHALEAVVHRSKPPPSNGARR